MFWIVTGKPAVGKTFNVIKMIKDGYKFPSVFIDTANESKYSKMNLVNIKPIGKNDSVSKRKGPIYTNKWGFDNDFENGKMYVYRPPFNLSMSMNEVYYPFIDSVVNTFADHRRRGMVVLDDSGNIFTRDVNEKVKRFVISRRNLNIDLICIFHEIKEVPKDFWPRVSKLIIYKQESVPSNRLSLPKKDLIIETQKRVNSHPDLRYFEHINF